MSVKPLINLAKENSDKFYVKDNDFIIDKTTGTLMIINPIDDLITGLPKEDADLWHKDVKAVVDEGFLEEVILEMYEKQYLKR